MANRTITALYDTSSQAEDAKKRLVASGISSSSIEIHDESSMISQSSSSSTPQEGGFLSGLKNMFGSHDDTHAYAEGLKRGHYLLTAKVDEYRADAAVTLLDSTGAVDFDQKQTEWKGAGWAAPATTAARAGDDTIKIVEEQLVVGKREVERGGVRVRSYIVETPVSEKVSLRDESVDVERRPVNRPLTAADNAFEERTIEMREMGEEAVVAKAATVKEELVIRKDVGERTEEVRDTVRHTEVEVDRIPATEKSLASDTTVKPRI